MCARIAERSMKRRGVSDIDQDTDPRVFDERISRRDATLGDDFGRPAAARRGWKFYFYYFQRPSFFARAGSRLDNSSRKEIACFAERSIKECYPRYPSLARTRHVSSSIYNCCPPRDFCVVEKSARFFFGYRSDRAGRAL